MLGSGQELRICLTSRIMIYLNNPIQEKIINHQVSSESAEQDTTDCTQENVAANMDNVENEKEG